jgi:hypothetical protein
VLGDLDRQQFGPRPGRAERVDDEFDQPVAELSPANVDGHLQMAHRRIIPPPAERLAGGHQNESIDIRGEVRAFGKRDEYRR